MYMYMYVLQSQSQYRRQHMMMMMMISHLLAADAHFVLGDDFNGHLECIKIAYYI